MIRDPYDLEIRRCEEHCGRVAGHSGRHRPLDPDCPMPEPRCTVRCGHEVGHPGVHLFPASVFDRPLARNGDPWTAHLAAALIQSTLSRRCALVLDYLEERIGQWVNGYELTGPEVGGSEGLRRLRQLRYDLGFNIERRPAPDPSLTAWQYRLSAEVPWIGSNDSWSEVA